MLTGLGANPLVYSDLLRQEAAKMSFWQHTAAAEHRR